MRAAVQGLTPEWIRKRMALIVNQVSSMTTWGYFSSMAVSALLVASLLGCADVVGDAAKDELMVELEAEVASLQESLDALADENAELREENSVLRERLTEQDAELRELEKVAAKAEALLSSNEQWSKDKDAQWSPPKGDALERTIALVEDFGGELHYVHHAGRGDRSVLVTPVEFVEGWTPLIVSLHGFGGDSAYQADYVPFHERVDADGFALLLPNGTFDSEGNRFWNPTDRCCDGGKSGEDDVGYLTELVANAMKIKDFGPVYFFGYSNGGFMSHHVACKGLPGLRAVASLAGTSYVEDSSCDGSPPVSMLQIHGTADDVILFDGDRSERDSNGDDPPAFYLGALDMVMRGSSRAGCEWPKDPRPYARLDLDRYVQGSETQAFRAESGCAEGISIELWKSVGSSHAPEYGEAFLDALIEWFLSQA